jgi:dihydroneopterin aldolase
VSASLYTDIRKAGDSDDVLDIINYGTVYKAWGQALSNSKFRTLQHCVEEVCKICIKVGGVNKVLGTVALPKGLLRTEGEDGGIEMRLELIKTPGGGTTMQSRVLLVKNLRLSCILGVNPHERKDKQLVVVNLELIEDIMTDEADYQTQLMPVIQVCSARLSCLISFITFSGNNGFNVMALAYRGFFIFDPGGVH